MNVRELLARSAKFHSEREAVIDGCRRISFSEALDRGIRFANGLLSLGLKPQDKVGVLEDNSLESADAYIGLAIANMVRVPLYAGSSLEIHSHMLGHTDCRALIVSPSRLKETEGLKGLTHIIVRDKNYESWLLSQSDKMPQIDIDSNDLFIIRHSGGTSGLPKGIGITHKNWITSMRDWFFPLPPIIPGDAFLHVSPMSHASGYMFLPVWAAGGRNIMLSPFEPAKCFEAMEQENVSYAFVPPSDLNALVNFGLSARPPRRPALKALMSGGAPISGKLIQGIKNILGNVLYQSYGQTEAGIVSIGSPWQWDMEGSEGTDPILSCGTPLHFADIEIMDGDMPQPPGQAGEIVVRTDGMMNSYWGYETKSDAWKESRIHTGDMGKLDINGFLYILGRKEDVIITDSGKIYPLELENLICSHPGILEAAVVEVPNDKSGQTIVAYCVVNEGSSVKEHELRGICLKKAHFGTASLYIKITTEGLPKNNIGKIIRKELQTNAGILGGEWK